jgi:uncharacterized small protein (DUF1192 family)
MASMISEDSDLGSQLSSMRSEVFGDYGFNDTKDRMSGGSKSKKQLHARDSRKPPSPKRSPSEDSNSPHSDFIGSNFKSFRDKSSFVKPPPNEKHLSRAVIETEQMGMRLSEEIQRLRAELKKATDHQADMSTVLRRTKAENDDLRDEVDELKAHNKKLAAACDDMSSDNDKLRRELVLYYH